MYSVSNGMYCEESSSKKLNRQSYAYVWYFESFLWGGKFLTKILHVFWISYVFRLKVTAWQREFEIYCVGERFLR